jgi:DNA-binding NtrC family response regulator
VDDDESLVESLRRTLSKAGYPVTKRTSPAAALHGPPVTGLTVLVTDLDMPGMDGIELSRQMLAHDPDLAVIVLTGSATVESAAAALELGLIEYLQKPLGVDLLVEAVGRALRERARNIFRRECGAANEE